MMYINEHHERAMSLLKKGQAAEALSAIEPLVKEHSKNPDLWHDRGVIYYHLQRLRDALEDMNRAQELQPKYSYRYASRAFIRDSMGDVKGAIADYQIAIKLDPDDAIALNNLGLLEEKLGHSHKARMFFDLADEMAREQGIVGGKDLVERPKPVNLQKEIDKNHANQLKMGTVIKQTLSTRNGWKELATFIANGFRIKPD